VFARTRTADIRRDDLKRLMERVEELQSDDEIPGASRAFVRPPTNERIYDGGFDLKHRGLVLPDSPLGGGGFTGPSGNSPPNGALKEDSIFFFPLPYNEEQISVVKALEEHDGVVVQGPPGTGKTPYNRKHHQSLLSIRRERSRYCKNRRSFERSPTKTSGRYP
jgi:hypothetical protein